MQRLRIRFCRGEEIKFISHLDIIRLWQRALHRAQIPLAYSEGFNPRPRISLAAPLAIGVTSEVELMDMFCTKWVSPHWFTSAVSRQLPPGIKILQVFSLALNQPSLQSQVRYVEYKVEVATENEELRAFFEFAQTNPTYDYRGGQIIARVIGEGASPYVDIVEIDLGKVHGIEVGMPVVTDRGLIGRVVEVLAEREARTPGDLLGRTGTNKAVVFPASGRAIGAFVDVRLLSTTGATFIGEVVS